MFFRKSKILMLEKRELNNYCFRDAIVGKAFDTCFGGIVEQELRLHVFFQEVFQH